MTSCKPFSSVLRNVSFNGNVCFLDLCLVMSNDVVEKFDSDEIRGHHSCENIAQKGRFSLLKYSMSNKLKNPRHNFKCNNEPEMVKTKHDLFISIAIEEFEREPVV